MDLDVNTGTEGIVDLLRLAGHLTSDWGTLAVLGVALATYAVRRLSWTPAHLFALFREAATAGGASGAALGLPALILDLAILPVQVLAGIRRRPGRARIGDVLKTMETILDVAAQANAKTDALARHAKARAETMVALEASLRDEARNIRHELGRHEASLQSLSEFRAQFGPLEDTRATERIVRVKNA